jgi:hypothetical protein
MPYAASSAGLYSRNEIIGNDCSFLVCELLRLGEFLPFPVYFGVSRFAQRVPPYALCHLHNRCACHSTVKSGRGGVRDDRHRLAPTVMVPTRERKPTRLVSPAYYLAPHNVWAIHPSHIMVPLTRSENAARHTADIPNPSRPVQRASGSQPTAAGSRQRTRPRAPRRSCQREHA